MSEEQLENYLRNNNQKIWQKLLTFLPSNEPLHLSLIVIYNFLAGSAVWENYYCTKYNLLTILGSPNKYWFWVTIKYYQKPKSDSSQNFTVGHWNLNSIRMQHFLKTDLLKAYVTVHKTDIFHKRWSSCQHRWSSCQQAWDFAFTARDLYSWKPFIFNFWKNVSTFTLLPFTFIISPYQLTSTHSLLY